MNKFMDILNWYKIPVVYCSAEKIDELITELENNKHLAELSYNDINKARRLGFFLGTWQRKLTESSTELRVCSASGSVERYIWLRDKVINQSDTITDETTGRDAYNYIEELYKEKLGKKSASLFSDFSGKKYKKQYTAIKNCVPVQVQFLNKKYKGKIVEGCTKADVSSAFPSQMIKDLPTLHDYKEEQGRIEPSKEYPFCFYVKSGHIKTLDGINTKTFANPFYGKYYLENYRNVPDNEEITIRCKSMEKEQHDALAEAFKELYKHRKDDTKLKFFMNACIGYFQLNSNPGLSFISAIVIARCNSDMFKRAEELEKRKKPVLFIATDSICWKGGEDKLATDEKFLGSFTYEGKGVKFLGYSPKAYQWITPEGKTTTKYSGMKKEESAKLKFGELVYKSELEKTRYLRDEKSGHMTKI